MQPEPSEQKDTRGDSPLPTGSHQLSSSSLPASGSSAHTVSADPLVPSAEIHALAMRYFKDLLRINSSNPPGLERPAIDYAAEILRENGIPFRVLEGHPGRPNLFAELPGPEGASAILLSSHVDVVPVEFPANWKHDPFGGIEEDGMIYGRGAIDMKYKTAYDLAFMVHASKFPRTRAVKLLALSDEEAGADAGSRYVTANHRSLIDAEYVFNEVGGFNMRLGAKEILPIQAAEKGFCHLRLEVRGHSMHASIPTQQSAALTLARALVAINQGFDVYSVCSSARVFLETVAAGQPAQIEQLFRGLLSEKTFPAAVQAFPDPALRAQITGLLCHTVTPCILNAGVKVNVTPGKAIAEFDCRLVPGLSKTQLLERLEKALGPELAAASKLDVVTFSDGYELDVDDPMLALVGKELESYWRQRFGEAHFAPLLLPASSDNAVYFNAGIKPIGFAPLKFPEGFPGFALAHADDERIPRESFERGLECYFHVIGKLTLS